MCDAVTDIHFPFGYLRRRVTEYSTMYDSSKNMTRRERKKDKGAIYASTNNRVYYYIFNSRVHDTGTLAVLHRDPLCAGVGANAFVHHYSITTKQEYIVYVHIHSLLRLEISSFFPGRKLNEYNNPDICYLPASAI